MKLPCFEFKKIAKLICLFVLFISSLFLKACSLKKNDFEILKNDENLKREEVAMENMNIKKVVLENGLTILIFKNIQTPKVLLQIAYDVGSWIEESGEKGLAHLIEHMIFKGTEKLNEGDIEAVARKYGADLNAFTSVDMTSYFFEVNKNNWKPFMGILADCMQNARFDEQHLASELIAVICVSTAPIMSPHPVEPSAESCNFASSVWAVGAPVAAPPAT